MKLCLDQMFMISAQVTKSIPTHGRIAYADIKEVCHLAQKVKLANVLPLLLHHMQGTPLDH